MRHIYIYNNHSLSEETLLGLGGGVGFVYWHMKWTDPFMGGRGKGRPGKGFEQCVGERSGVRIDEFTTSSARKAEKSLMTILEAGQPVMVYADMGFLPYFHFRRDKLEDITTAQINSYILKLIESKEYKPQKYLFEGQTGGKYSSTSVANILKRAASKGLIIPANPG